jgi:hypothetical protein
MWSWKRHVYVLALVLAASAVPTASAHARARWGAVTIQNHSEVGLSFQMRLGTRGPWTDYNVPAYTNYTVYFRLNSRGRVPSPHIRFDNSKGRTRRYSLNFYEVNRAANEPGKPYKFEYKARGGWNLYTAD